MKMNKKIIVSTLALAMGAALAGSVSGTVAWFQYSTRAQVSYMETTAHCSELLQVSLDGGTTWKSEFKTSDIKGISGLTHNGENVVPITSGGVAKDGAVSDFYANPIYQISGDNYDTWTAAPDDSYLQFSMLFRVIDVNENYDAVAKTASTFLAKDVFLTDLTLESGVDGNDLGDALRVHIAANDGGKFLIANTATSTATNGKLDLNADGANDQTEGYEWDTDRTDITYGTGTQTSYAKSEIVATDTNGVLTNGVKLGTTNAQTFSITVTVWLEGWQSLTKGANGSASTIWNSKDYVGVDFHVGMRFAVPLHDNANE